MSVEQWIRVKGDWGDIKTLLEEIDRLSELLYLQVTYPKVERDGSGRLRVIEG